MKNNYIWKIKHIPTGLFYCSKKGRFNDDKTNLSTKGNFYESEKYAQKVYEEDCEGSSINKAQTERYELDRNVKEHMWCYNLAKKEDFQIVKYELVEVGD